MADWSIGQPVFIASRLKHARGGPDKFKLGEGRVTKIGRKWVTYQTTVGDWTERFNPVDGEVDPGEFSSTEERAFPTAAERDEFIAAYMAWEELRQLMRSNHQAPAGLKAEPLRTLITAIEACNV